MWMFTTNVTKPHQKNLTFEVDLRFDTLMDLVKYDPSSKKEICNVSSSDVNTSKVAVSGGFSNLNPSQFYCKRIIVHSCKGDEPSVTRIEETIFRCRPQESMFNRYNFSNDQPSEQICGPDDFTKLSHSRRKSSHSSKHKSHHKCSSKKDAKSHHKCKEYKALYKKIAISVILGCPFLVWWLSTLHWCQAKPLDFLDLEKTLKNGVIGQEEALNSLLLNFYRTSNLYSQPPVFLLSGSTGLGKSFITDIIINNFPGFGYKELLFYPTPAPESVVKKLKECEHNLLVLDGLYYKDAGEIASWIGRLQKEAVIQRKQVWVLIVFTTEHWASDATATSSTELHQEILKISYKIDEVFKEKGISAQLIPFKPMEVHNVKECVRKELENSNLLADETQLDQIVLDLTSTSTLRQKGCKHVKKYFLHSAIVRGLPKALN